MDLLSTKNDLKKSENTKLLNVKSLKKKTYSKNAEVKLLTIGLASPARIRQWAEKTLPNGKIIGEVSNANTLHHKTFKPQKGGLFCERIFGPLKDFECACGKHQKPNKNLLFSQKPVAVPSSFLTSQASLRLPTGSSVERDSIDSTIGDKRHEEKEMYEQK